jgi:pimeloyl-ACP methyl ester carboxylesterase
MTTTSAAAFRDLTIEIHEGARRLPMAALANYGPGQAPDVIWLHANGFNAGTYVHTLAQLTGRLNILAIDQRGHGRTPQQQAIETKTDWLGNRDDLLALLKALDAPRPVVLAGHSMGGCVSLLAAAEAPQRVRALALFDPVIISKEAQAYMFESGRSYDSPLIAGARSRRRAFPSRQAVFESYQGRSIFKAWPDEALRGYVEAGFRELADGTVELSCTPEWEAAGFAGQAHDIWGAMARVQAPVSIWRAEVASTCSIADASAFPRPPGQVSLVTVPGTTHFLPIERPDVVRTGLLEVAGG